ncbi:MAG: hypothetical protein Q7T86_15745 [Hyphomicrobiaceae bacterium]|nr:hypothetical protein [Hyphomicrobiaceae bacterium]
MLKWLSGKLVHQDFRRNLRYVQENLGSSAARDCCSSVLRQIFIVKSEAKFGADAELKAAHDAYLLTKRSTPSGWLTRTRPETAAVALLEDWLSAKVASLNGALEPQIFLAIDNELWSFAKERLKPSEIEAIHSEAEAALTHRRRNATDAINALIRDYAELAQGTGSTPSSTAGTQRAEAKSGEALRG